MEKTTGLLHFGIKKQRLTERFEKLLVHLGIFNGSDIILHTGAYQQSGLFFGAYGYRHAGQIFSIIKRPPASEVGIEYKQLICFIQIISWMIRPATIVIEPFFSRNNTQFLIQYVDIKKEVLHGSHRNPQDFSSIRGVVHPALDGPQFNLTVFRHQDLAFGTPLDFRSPLHGAPLKHQTHEQHQGKTA